MTFGKYDAGTGALCGVRAGTRATAYRCTRPIGHGGDHIAAIGPWQPGEVILARWRQGSDPSRDDLAIDADGTPLPLTTQEVRAELLRMIDEGDLLAAIVRMPNGDVGVQVYGPPSTLILEVLQQAIDGMRAALEHRGGPPGPQGDPA